MGGGAWSTSHFANYTTTTKAMNMADFASADSLSVQTVYKSRALNQELNPYMVRRECRDSDEHPNTVPVILALDVTGSMGDASVRVAQKLNEIMTSLYANENVKDIEFCVMGIGDLYCDDAPIQISQFESDIRIAEQLDQIYFEGGGGGNGYESYSAAWYMGTYRCDLDCWKRGKKGIIITLGDELPNPHLHNNIQGVLGGEIVKMSTADLLAEAQKKFNIYHISVNDKHSSYKQNNIEGEVDAKWKQLLGSNYNVASLDNLSATIVSIIQNDYNNVTLVSSNEVSW